jgi:hypothetical protein
MMTYCQQHLPRRRYLNFGKTIKDAVAAETEGVKTYTGGKTPRTSDDSWTLGIQEFFNRAIGHAWVNVNRNIQLLHRPPKDVILGLIVHFKRIVLARLRNRLKVVQDGPEKSQFSDGATQLLRSLFRIVHG